MTISLSGIFRAKLFPDFPDVGNGFIDGNRIIFPVGQNVDHHKIGGRRNLRMFEPELPDIGIGDRHFRQGGLDLADIFDKLGSGDFTAQQDFVSHNDSPYAGRVAPGQFNDFCQFLLIENRITADPGAQKNLHTVFFGKDRHSFQSGDGICTDIGKSA